jgi:hypothetical protein
MTEDSIIKQELDHIKQEVNSITTYLFKGNGNSLDTKVKLIQDKLHSIDQDTDDLQRQTIELQKLYKAIEVQNNNNTLFVRVVGALILVVMPSLFALAGVYVDSRVSTMKASTQQQLIEILANQQKVLDRLGYK